MKRTFSRDGIVALVIFIIVALIALEWYRTSPLQIALYGSNVPMNYSAADALGFAKRYMWRYGGLPLDAELTSVITDNRTQIGGYRGTQAMGYTFEWRSQNSKLNDERLLVSVDNVPSSVCLSYASWQPVPAGCDDFWAAYMMHVQFIWRTWRPLWSAIWTSLMSPEPIRSPPTLELLNARQQALPALSLTDDALGRAADEWRQRQQYKPPEQQTEVVVSQLLQSSDLTHYGVPAEARRQPLIVVRVRTSGTNGVWWSDYFYDPTSHLLQLQHVYRRR